MTQNDLQREIERLYQVTIYARWSLVIVCWLTLGIFGIWGLREEIALLQQYFTWAAVRYAIVYNRISALCLSFCIGMTAAVLIRQSQHLLQGFSEKEKYRLEQQVKKIRAVGSRHLLWKWVINK